MATSISDHPAAAAEPTPEEHGHAGTGLLVVAGVGAIAAAGYLVLRRKPAAAPAPVPVQPPPPIQPPPPTPPPCAHVDLGRTSSGGYVLGHGGLRHNSQWYNWSDLRPLPLDGGPCGPGRGGDTNCTGTQVGWDMSWSEGKLSGGRWYVRIFNVNRPGDWALLADDIGAYPQAFC